MGKTHNPNDHLKAIISSSSLEREVTDAEYGPLPRSELDSHANMVVLCDHSFVFDQVDGNTCDVLPFDPNIGKSTEVPIVDGCIAYNCPNTQRTYLLVFKNALHVPSMKHNLIPPFILREAGLVVNDTPKIHLQQPTQSDHAIIDPSSDLSITLQLHNIFSFFHSRKPTADEIAYSPRILMTPDSLD